jgi:hypothetical protein
VRVCTGMGVCVWASLCVCVYVCMRVCMRVCDACAFMRKCMIMLVVTGVCVCMIVRVGA